METHEKGCKTCKTCRLYYAIDKKHGYCFVHYIIWPPHTVKEVSENSTCDKWEAGNNAYEELIE